MLLRVLLERLNHWLAARSHRLEVRNDDKAQKVQEELKKLWRY